MMRAIDHFLFAAAFGAAAALAFAACAAPVPVVPITPGEEIRTTPYPGSDHAGDPADRACMRLWECWCPESDRNPAGEWCPVWMRRSKGLVDVECIRAATTCGGLRVCGVTKCARAAASSPGF